jgi:cell filamentation protein
LSDGTVATEPTLRKVSGRPFSDGEAIAAALGGIEATLREANYLRGLPREDFAERAADIMAGLNAIHPFREGNGRTQRVFIEQLAHAAGHELDFTVVSKERMTQASIAAHEENDPSMMRRMFAEISDPARAALLREGIEKLQTAFGRDAQRTGKTPVHWNDHYLATLAPGHSVELVFAGVAGDQFMARSNTQILFGNVSDLPEPRPERGQTFVVTALPRSQQQRCQGQDTASLTPAAPAESPREAAQRERDERIARALQEYAPELNAQHSPGRGGSKR